MVVAVALAGCGGGAPAKQSDEQSPTPQRSAAIYAAVVRAYVTGNTYEHIYILDGVDPDAGNPDSGSRKREPFSVDLRDALRAELADLPGMRFVRDPDSAWGVSNVPRGSVLITLGPITGNGDRVTVPNSFVCGELCAQWLTSVVQRTGAAWRVHGHVGPVAVS